MVELEQVIVSDERNALVLNSIPEPAVILDVKGEIFIANQVWLASPFRHLLDDTGWAGQIEFRQGMVRVLTRQLEVYIQEVRLGLNGSDLTYVARMTPILINETHIAGALLIFYNITTQKRLEQSLRNSAETFRLIAEHSHDMIKITAPSGHIEYASPSLKTFLGNDNADSNVFDFIYPDDLNQLKAVYEDILRTKESFTLEFRKRDRNGNWMWLEAVCSPVISEEGTVQNIIIVSREINERKQYEYELEHMAYHDFLTGLYNRRKVRLILEDVLVESSESGQSFAVFIMDLDKFKLINDTYGHDIGDLVLKKFASHLLACKKEEDIAGRLSGDEFVVIMKDAAEQEVYDFILRLQHELSEPCIVPGSDLHIRIKTSVGYALFPEDGSTVSELLKQADIALYRMKENITAKSGCWRA